MDNVVIDITEIVENVEITISESGSPGVGVPSGGETRDVLTKESDVDFDTAWKPKYYDYLINVEYTGVETNIASGTVLTATIDGDTVYRFINDTKNANGYPVEDSFYAQFDGSTLTELIITRG